MAAIRGCWATKAEESSEAWGVKVVKVLVNHERWDKADILDYHRKIFYPLVLVPGTVPYIKFRPVE